MQFWEVFTRHLPMNNYQHLPVIKKARMAGLFWHYGLLKEDKTVIGVVNEREHPLAFKYLDAFCTVEIDSSF